MNPIIKDLVTESRTNLHRETIGSTSRGVCTSFLRKPIATWDFTTMRLCQLV